MRTINTTQQTTLPMFTASAQSKTDYSKIKFGEKISTKNEKTDLETKYQKLKKDNDNLKKRYFVAATILAAVFNPSFKQQAPPTKRLNLKG